MYNSNLVLSDPYILRYILEYLKICDGCQRYDSFDKKKECNICKEFYCFDCNNYLIPKLSGFTTSIYCRECYNYFFFY